MARTRTPASFRQLGGQVRVERLRLQGRQMQSSAVDSLLCRVHHVGRIEELAHHRHQCVMRSRLSGEGLPMQDRVAPWSVGIYSSQMLL